MSKMMLKCTFSGGSHVIRDLTSDSSLQELLDSISKVSSIDGTCMKLKGGFPPKPIALEDKVALLADLGIRSGDSLHVEVGAPSSNSVPTPAPSSNLQASGVNGYAGHYTKPKRSILRKVVPANNSCLFASVGFLLQGDSGVTMATALRCVVADLIVNTPDQFPEIVLGKAPSEYASWIQNQQVWGGGIELAALAQHFNTEIHVVDTQSLRIDRFGQELGSQEKTYVIYDGIHYDALYEATGHVTVFPRDDGDIEKAAMLLATSANKEHNFTDLANFSLRCSTCRLGLRGESDARLHAKNTGHSNFEEYR